jgi:hypothetical protein
MKRRFLQQQHGVTSHKMAFFREQTFSPVYFPFSRILYMLSTVTSVQHFHTNTNTSEHVSVNHANRYNNPCSQCIGHVNKRGRQWEICYFTSYIWDQVTGHVLDGLITGIWVLVEARYFSSLCHLDSFWGQSSLLFEGLWSVCNPE